MMREPKLTTPNPIRKFKALLLGGRPMVGLQTLDLAIGVRVPASQPISRMKDEMSCASFIPYSLFFVVRPSSFIPHPSSFLWVLVQFQVSAQPPRPRRLCVM